MREIIARLVCVLTVIVVLTLAHGFAARHNAKPSAPDPSRAAGIVGRDSVVAPEIIRGREVYAAQGCASCHAVAGAGNPRNPLDGVGARLTRTELFEWMTGTGTAASRLAGSVVRRKERYRELSREDSDALIAYLASLAPAK